VNPTDEQTHIVDLSKATDSNLLINAYAGTGKTATLEMIERAVKAKPILYLVFNKRNALEAEGRMLSTTTVRTFNSIGHRIWARAQVTKNLRVAPKKSADILRSIIDDSPKAIRSEIWSVFWDVVNAVALAKALGYIPEGKFPIAKPLISAGAFHARLDEKPDDLIADLIDAVLLRSIKEAYNGSIDFNDQIYMPALFGGTFPKFPLVLVDEGQDQNPVNLAMLKRLTGSSRSIVVGDRNQAIYQFRGAEENGMDKIAAAYGMTPCDLSVSFRCPEAIVTHARWRVPNFKWSNPGGKVEKLTELALSDIPDHAAIICRNNAPLFRLALRLLASGRSVAVVGSDVGPRLIGMMRKLGPEDMSQASVKSAISDWLAERLAKESKTAEDLAACMRVFADYGATLGQAIAYAEHLLKQSGTIQLLTGHKSKGLEFETVYFLDEFLLRDDEQDQNLRYVIQTRSKNQLFYIESSQIQ
jgi:superfamily I DNA/RNA helicase